MLRTLLAFATVIIVVAAAAFFAPPATGLSALGTQTASAGSNAHLDQSGQLLDLRGIGVALPETRMSGTLQETLVHLAEVGGFRVSFEDFDRVWLGNEKVRWMVVNVTIGRMLDDLSRAHGLRYEVPSHGLLIVRPAYDEPGALRVAGRDVETPTLIHKVKPVYPAQARRAEVQGIVVLEVTVGPTGTVEDVRVVRGLEMGLSEAATHAVRQWRWTPTVVDGKAVQVSVATTVTFKLQ